jgi:hypothetical protein
VLGYHSYQTHHHNESGTNFNSYHWPGFSSGDPMDEIIMLAKLRQSALAIRGEKEADVAPPEPAPEFIVEGDQLTGWRGSVGAECYDIEVKDEQGGGWQTVAEGLTDNSDENLRRSCDTLRGLAVGKLYRIVARNRVGRSTPSKDLKKKR